MTAASPATVERSDFRFVLISGTKTGVVTAAAVILGLIITRLVPAGITRDVLQTLVVLAGAAAASFLPAAWGGARTTQGVATAAAIGLWGTVVFMAIDIVVLRPLNHVVGTYPWQWDAIGGGSTWWYLPVWWMLGTFLAWMGALVTAGRAVRGGDTSIRALALPLVIGAAAVGLGLGLGGVIAMPVAAGGAFTLGIAVFALLALARRP